MGEALSTIKQLPFILLKQNSYERTHKDHFLILKKLIDKIKLSTKRVRVSFILFTFSLCVIISLQGDHLNMAVFSGNFFKVTCPVYATVHDYTGQVT